MPSAGCTWHHIEQGGRNADLLGAGVFHLQIHSWITGMWNGVKSFYLESLITDLSINVITGYMFSLNLLLIVNSLGLFGPVPTYDLRMPRFIPWLFSQFQLPTNAHRWWLNLLGSCHLQKTWPEVLAPGTCPVHRRCLGHESVDENSLSFCLSNLKTNKIFHIFTM